MIDLSKFDFIEKTTLTGRPSNNNLRVYKGGMVIVPAAIGKDLPPLIDFGISKDGKQIVMRDGYTIKVTPNGRKETNAKKFSAKRISAKLLSCGISFPSAYVIEKDGDVFVGHLLQE